MIILDITIDKINGNFIMNIEDKKDIYNRVMESLSSDVKKLLEDYELDDYSDEEFKQKVNKIKLPEAIAEEIEDQINAKERFNGKLERLWEFMKSFNINSIPENIRAEQNKVDYKEEYLIWCKRINEGVDDFEQDYSGIERKIKIDENAKVLAAGALACKLNDFFGINEKYNARLAGHNGIRTVEVAGGRFSVENEPLGLAVPLGDDELRKYASQKYINIYIVDKICMEYGYYRVREVEKKDGHKRPYVCCIYIPVRDVPVREQILRHKTLVHTSPKQFYEQIKTEGIVPKNSKRTYNYLYPRTYFYLSEEDIIGSDYDSMMRGICRKSFKKDMINSTIYNIYYVDCDRRVKSLKIYWDPVSDNCVYSRSTIAPRFIRRVYWTDYGNSYDIYHELDEGADDDEKLPGDKGRD